MKIIKRMLAAVLVLAALLPVMGADAAEQPASIEDQIRAYARSIDQSRADSDAAMDLAYHGIRGNGKKLTMDASSPMAATLLNSEVVQEGMAVIFEDVIETMQRLDMSSVPGVDMTFGWYGAGSKNTEYIGYILTDSGEYPDNLDWVVTSHPYTGTLNSYDNSLEWMVGGCLASAQIQCIKDSSTQKTYKLTVTFEDRFDFSTAKNSGFKKFFSVIGMKLFKEFDWSCTVTMEITAPYSYDHCNHGSGAYHWTYDGENFAMISDGAGDYIQNNTSHRSHTVSDGTVHHYYELDNTVRLYHHKPWVLEYDVQKPSRVLFAPVDNAVTKTYPQIEQRARTSLFVVTKDYAMAQTPGGNLDRYYAYNYCGTKLGELYPFAYDKAYTIRLENEVRPDGSNGIYLTAIETDTGAVCLDRIPMDDQYYYGGWMEDTIPVSEGSRVLSGKDFYINYFGTRTSGFKAAACEIRIWENGETGETGSYWEDNSVAPTCTADGYVLRKCSRCGLTERIAGEPALGHRYGEWTQVLAPGCGTAGRMERQCSGCGDTQHQEIAALTHEFGGFSSDGNATCTKDGTVSASCLHCGMKDTREDPGSALGHSMSPWVVAVEPGCETAGQERTQCSREGCVYEETRALSALGHSFGQWEVTKEPTTTEKGVETRKCACGEEETREIDTIKMYGDVNGDGVVDSDDAALICYYDAELIGADELNLSVGDVTGDGRVDSDDAALICYMDAELMDYSEFPCFKK